MEVVLLHSIRQLRKFTVKDGDKSVGAIWGFVINELSWNISHIVVNASARFQDQGILISQQALLKPRVQNKILPVSLSVSKTEMKQVRDPVDLDSSPYVTKLNICMGPPQGWALTRPMPLPAFPMPMVSSFYVMEKASSVQGVRKHDAHPQSCRDLIDSQVQATDGRAGAVDDLLLDDNCWQIRYVVIDTGRWFPSRKVFLSTSWLKHASENEPTLLVDLPKEAIKNGPEFDPATPINRKLESTIFAHYGRTPYWEENRREDT